MSRDMLSLPNDDSIGLRLLGVLRRRWGLAVAVFLTVLAAGVALVLSLPDLYRASATVMVERPVSESFVPSGANAELETRLHVIKQEILSRSRLRDLIERFDLYPDLRRRSSWESVLDQARRDIQLELMGPEQLSGRTKTVAFQLSYISPDPRTVADVTNEIASFYVAQNDRIRAEEAQQTTAFLEAQVEEVKAELALQEARVEAFNRRHMGELPQQVQLNLSTLDRLNAQLRINGDRQIRTMDQRQKLIDTAEWAEVTRQMSEMRAPRDDRLAEMRRDLQQLEAQFTDKHPDVVRLRTEIEALEREAAEREAARAPAAPPPNAAVPTPEMRRRMLERLDAELAMLKDEEADLRGKISAVEARLVDLPQRQQEFAQVTRDYQATQEQYESLLKRLDEARLASSMEQDRRGERFRVLESAVVPRDPSVPDRPRLLLLAALLALAAGIGFVFAADQLDASFHSVDDVREFTSVPVVAVIPRIEPRPGRVYLRAALAAASLLLMVALAAAAASYMGHGNEQLVRLLVRTG